MPSCITSVSSSEHLRLFPYLPCCTEEISMPVSHRIAKLIFKCIWLIINHLNMKLNPELDERRELAQGTALNQERGGMAGLHPATAKETSVHICSAGCLPWEHPSSPALCCHSTVKWISKVEFPRLAAGAGCYFPNGSSFLVPCPFTAPHFAANP